MDATRETSGFAGVRLRCPDRRFAYGASATKPVPQGPISGPEMQFVGISPQPGAVFGPPPAGPGDVPWDTRNTDLAFWGDRVIQGRYDGFRVIDVKNKRAPVEIAYHKCISPQGDIGVYGNLVFRSVDGPQLTNGCTTASTQNGSPTGAACAPATSPCTGFEGIQIFDISNLSDIKLVESVALDCGSHTHTVVPELSKNRVLIYNQVSGNGRQNNPGKYGNQCLRNQTTDPEFNKADIVSVPLDNPAAAALLHQYDLGVHEGVPTEVCHDYGVILGAVNMGACAGHMVAIFDLTDPAAPKFMHGSMPSPEVSIFHSAAFTWDGSKVISGWEPGGGTAPRCQAVGTVFPGTQGVQTVDMRTAWIHDSMTGNVVGRYFMPRSQSADENCTVHNLNLAPADKRYGLIHGSYQSGTTYVDFTNLANPYEVAWMDPLPLDPTTADPGRRPHELPRRRLGVVLVQRLHLRERHAARPLHLEGQRTGDERPLRQPPVPEPADEPGLGAVRHVARQRGADRAERRHRRQRAGDRPAAAARTTSTRSRRSGATTTSSRRASGSTCSSRSSRSVRPTAASPRPRRRLSSRLMTDSRTR